MKKELFCYLTFLLCVAICFVSCSDKDETIVCPIKNFTFTDVSGLALTYSGKPMLGKKVEFIPDAADATKARLILSGALVDLSDMLGSVAMNSRAGITDLLKFASPGVIPGEKTTELHVTLNIDGDMVTFSGEEEQNGGIIRYNGSATKSFLKLDLNVALPENGFADTSWTLVPQKSVEPVYYVWKTSANPIWGSILVRAIFTAKVVDNKSIPQLLSAILKEVRFLPDGNIQAVYKNGIADAEWNDSDLNLAMYRMGEQENQIKLFLNLSQIMDTAMSVTTLSRASGISSVDIKELLKLIPMLSEGIPLYYEQDGNGGMKVYVGEDVLLPLLKAVKPLFEDEEFVNGLLEMLEAQAGDMASLVKALKPVLKSLPKVIDGTTEVKFGIMFTALQPSAETNILK